jgi:hypothetical protein
MKNHCSRERKLLLLKIKTILKETVEYAESMGLRQASVKSRKINQNSSAIIVKNRTPKKRLFQKSK